VCGACALTNASKVSWRTVLTFALPCEQCMNSFILACARAVVQPSHLCILGAVLDVVPNNGHILEVYMWMQGKEHLGLRTAVQ